MEIVKKFFFLITTIAFASCSSQNNTGNISKIVDLYKTGNQEKEIKIFKRDELNQVGYPLIELRSNGIIKQLLMIPISLRGSFTNFISGSGQGMTMMGSFIIRTFGMDLDLISVNIDKKSQFATKIPIKKWKMKTERSYSFLQPSNKSIKHNFLCSLKIQDEIEIKVVEKKHKTFLVIETCRNNNNQFQNRYWVEKDGIIIKSKQWVSIKNIYLDTSVIIPVGNYME